MTWLDWLKIVAFFVAASAVVLLALVLALWFGSKPLGSGPKRIVDVENRGQTRILMPDGTIK